MCFLVLLILYIYTYVGWNHRLLFSEFWLIKIIISDVAWFWGHHGRASACSLGSGDGGCLAKLNGVQWDINIGFYGIQDTHSGSIIGCTLHTQSLAATKHSPESPCQKVGDETTYDWDQRKGVSTIIGGAHRRVCEYYVNVSFLAVHT